MQATLNFSRQTSWPVDRRDGLLSTDIEYMTEPPPDYDVDRQVDLQRVAMEPSPHYDLAFTEVQQAFGSLNSSDVGYRRTAPLPEPDYDLPLPNQQQQQQQTQQTPPLELQASRPTRSSLLSEFLSPDYTMTRKSINIPPPDYD